MEYLWIIPCIIAFVGFIFSYLADKMLVKHDRLFSILGIIFSSCGLATALALLFLE